MLTCSQVWKLLRWTILTNSEMSPRYKITWKKSQDIDLLIKLCVCIYNFIKMNLDMVSVLHYLLIHCLNFSKWECAHVFYLILKICLEKMWICRKMWKHIKIVTPEIYYVSFFPPFFLLLFLFLKEYKSKINKIPFLSYLPNTDYFQLLGLGWGRE